jgi:hypothetical protein
VQSRPETKYLPGELDEAAKAEESAEGEGQTAGCKATIERCAIHVGARVHGSGRKSAAVRYEAVEVRQ